jgi:tetratricopeptide (TPR) repeat protein
MVDTGLSAGGSSGQRSPAGPVWHGDRAWKPTAGVPPTQKKPFKGQTLGSMQPSWLSLLVAVAVLTFSVSWCPSMAFAEDDAAAAKAHYETGVRHFDLSEYEPALAEFKEAYRNKPDPAFLYNIAQCHRKLGHGDEAVTFYQSYLRRAPDAKNRDEVERRIAELQSPRAVESAPIPNTSGGGPRPSPTSTEAQAKAAAQTVVTPLARSTIDLSAHEETAPKPHSAIYTRWWFWTAIGAVAAGTAVTVGVLARRDPTKIPTSSLGAQKVLQ